MHLIRKKYRKNDHTEGLNTFFLMFRTVAYSEVRFKSVSYSVAFSGVQSKLVELHSGVHWGTVFVSRNIQKATAERNNFS